MTAQIIPGTCGASLFKWISSTLKVCKECDAEYRDAGK